jgi:2-dehydro-3-deoxyphosphogluconate aldolase/(4S)-4-hydroxy-2-oxoglutarate aldolase
MTTNISQQIVDAGLVVIIRADRSDHLVDAARALHDGAVRVMEVTLNTPRALGAIAAIRDGVPDMVCGAGTVLGRDDAVAALGAGAQFVVTPTLQLDTIELCRSQGVPGVIGCASPSEMVAADQAGAAFVKVFPANRFGLVHIRAVLDEVPDLRLIPTGGVTAANVAEFFDAGCAAVAAGSTLVSRELLARRDWTGLTEAARRFTSDVSAARGREGGKP